MFFVFNDIILIVIGPTKVFVSLVASALVCGIPAGGAHNMWTFRIKGRTFLGSPKYGWLGDMGFTQNHIKKSVALTCVVPRRPTKRPTRLREVSENAYFPKRW